MPDTVADLDLFYELGLLRFIKRNFAYAPGCTNVAEHTLRTAYIALVLAKREGADIGRTLQIALLHDMAEIRTGDQNSWQKPYVTPHTLKAAEDMLGGTTLEDLMPLIHDYEKRESLESKIVKDADLIEAYLDMREQTETGSQCLPFFESKGFIADTLKTMRTESGRQFYQAITERRPLQRFAEIDSHWKQGKQGT